MINKNAMLPEIFHTFNLNMYYVCTDNLVTNTNLRDKPFYLYWFVLTYYPTTLFLLIVNILIQINNVFLDKTTV